MKSAHSIRFLFTHFLSGITGKSLNAFYYACSYAKADYSQFMNVTASMSLKLVPGCLRSQPVFLCIDDTMVAKFGKKFEDVSKLFGHAAHNGSNYLNGHCFVSLMPCVPVWRNRRIVYLAAPLGYRMWKKKASKLELAATMVRQAMPEFLAQKNIIILCDSWYAKKDLICVVDEYVNLDIICNARYDSAIYDLAPQPTDKKGRPAIHGKCLSPDKDFVLSDERVGDYYIGVRRVLTNLFGHRKVLAYVTAPEKAQGSRRLFFSTIFPHQMQIFCAWQEKAPLNQTGGNRMQSLPLLCYYFRWNIEVSYYGQKTFWSLCSYMIRSRKGIEMLVNMVNTAYCAMKIIPYQEEAFSKYRNESVQEFLFALSEEIRQEVFYATLLQKIENGIKSNALMKSLKQLLQQQRSYTHKL